MGKSVVVVVVVVVFGFFVAVVIVGLAATTSPDGADEDAGVNPCVVCVAAVVIVGGISVLFVVDMFGIDFGTSDDALLFATALADLNTGTRPPSYISIRRA